MQLLAFRVRLLKFQELVNALSKYPDGCRDLRHFFLVASLHRRIAGFLILVNDSVRCGRPTSSRFTDSTHTVGRSNSTIRKRTWNSMLEHRSAITSVAPDAAT